LCCGYGASGDTSNKATWDAGLKLLVQEWGEMMIAAMPGLLVGDDLIPCIWSSQPGFPTYDFRAVGVKAELRTMSRRTVGRGI